MKPVAVRTQRGFTLIELAVVLTIIAIVIGMSAQMSVSVIATMRLTAAQQKMKALENALMAFRTANDRIPCPADLTIAQGSANYGVEAANPGTCTGGTPAANHSAAGATNTGATGAEGAVPVVTLGLPADSMLDGWGNRFRYAVDVSMTATGAFPTVNIGCTDGAITVNDANANARSTGSIYALVSHGRNGHGAYTPSGSTVNAGSVNANELTNCHCTSTGVAATYAPTYVQMNPSTDPANALDGFDDLVSYKERWQMRTDWDKTGKCVYIYVADYGNSRVQQFNGSGAYMGQFSVTGDTSLAVDASGNVWTHDWDDTVKKFNSSGTLQLTIWDEYGYDVKIDASGNIWSSDAATTCVAEFNNSGTFLTTIGGTLNIHGGGPYGTCATGTGIGEFSSSGNSPGGIWIDSGGNFWVVDGGNNRVEKFNSSGTYLMTIGGGASCTSCASTASCTCSSGSGNGMFSSPSYVAVDAGGNIWVSDTGNCRVEEFNSSGTYLSQFGSCTWGTNPGQFADWGSPQGIAFDPSGNIWVSDLANSRVEEFSASGQYITSIGTGYNGVGGTIGYNGSGNGQFYDPRGIAIGGR